MISHMKVNDLVMIEWQDSAQPTTGWRFLEDIEDPGVINCFSVGWILRENDDAIILVPNIGDCNSEASKQGCGFIHIARSSITRSVKLVESE